MRLTVGGHSATAWNTPASSTQPCCLRPCPLSVRTAFITNVRVRLPPWPDSARECIKNTQRFVFFMQCMKALGVNEIRL